jgi:hypothetical protein
MKALYMTVHYDMGLGKNLSNRVRSAAAGTRAVLCRYASYCLQVRELLFTGRRAIVYWYASYYLLVRELLFMAREILFTSTRTTVYW